MNKKNTYISKYNKSTYKMYQFRVRKDERDLIEKLDNTSHRNRYITNLIREDLDRSILTIKEIKDRLRPIIEKYHIEELYLFGSYSRGEATRDSDVDIYCSLGDLKNEGWFPSGRLLEEFKEALKKEVDLITFGSTLHPLFMEQINTDKVRLF